jgi:hypothetical protein
MFAGIAPVAYSATQVEITKYPSSISLDINAQVTYDNLVVAIKVKDRKNNDSALFSLVGSGPSKKGTTVIIRSKTVRLEKQFEIQEVILEPNASLDPETKYSFEIKHYDANLREKVVDADLTFITPTIPVVDVETSECVTVGSGSFEACGIVNSTGTNDTVYLTMEVSQDKQSLENNVYRDIETFQYDGLATSGEHLILAEGLAKDRIFYYRIVAENGSGSDVGQIRVTKTLP